jgi:hypothetical protein
MDFHLDEPAWAALEREKPGRPFTVRAGGKVLRFRPAADLPAGLLLQAAADWRLFLGYVVVNTDDLGDADFPWWKAEHMLRLYRQHHGLCATPQDDARLFRLLDKPEYREAIEADLHEVYRQDLGALWRARRWRTLLSMVDRLRRNTHFSEVASQDEDLARLVLEHQDKDDRPAPSRRMAEFTVEAELLSVVADRLAELVQVQVAKKGGRAGSVSPQPRPKTAMARLQERREIAHVDFTLDRVFGRVDARGKPTGRGGKPLSQST